MMSLFVFSINANPSKPFTPVNAYKVFAKTADSPTRKFEVLREYISMDDCLRIKEARYKEDPDRIEGNKAKWIISCMTLKNFSSLMAPTDSPTPDEIDREFQQTIGQ